MSKITIYQTGNSFSSNQEQAIALAESSSFGELKNGKVIYSIYEVIYLLEKDKAESIKMELSKILNQLKK